VIKTEGATKSGFHPANGARPARVVEVTGKEPIKRAIEKIAKKAMRKAVREVELESTLKSSLLHEVMRQERPGLAAHNSVLAKAGVLTDRSVNLKT
jgi:hypothetical protein